MSKGYKRVRREKKTLEGKEEQVKNIFDKYGPENTMIFKISLLARETVGKSTLLKSPFLNSSIESETKTTFGIEFTTKKLELYGKGIWCQIFIYNSEERFRKLFRYYIQGSNGVILIYDISNAKTLSELSEWCQEIKNHLDYDPPLLLVGNKLDLEENREVSKELVENFKEKHDIFSSMEISLKTGENVEEMFLNIVKMILTEHYPNVIK